MTRRTQHTPPDAVLPEAHICRTCHRPLDWHVDDDTGLTAWQHTAYDRDTGNADHLPDPIPAEGQEVVGICDFCSEAGPRWKYPAESFEGPGYGSIGEWGACETCHQLIEAGKWNGIVRRAVGGIVKNKPWGHLLRRAERRRMKADLVEFHRQFRLHRTGPPERLW